MTINYSLTNRLLARRKRPTGPGVVTDIMSVTISQSRYSETSAAQADPNYPSATTGSYSAVQIAARVSPTERLTGTFQTFIDPKYKKPQQFSASASIMRPTSRIHRGLVEDAIHPRAPTTSMAIRRARRTRSAAGSRSSRPTDASAATYFMRTSI